jgi:ubiquinone biosynthesis monooxygenase Coq7
MLFATFPSSDRLIKSFDVALRVCFSKSPLTRAYPADALPLDALDESARRHAAGLMRVNHTGEICAQGLYQGQALLARDPEVRAALQKAAHEEIDHLAWCRTRLDELKDRPSHLDPLWYAGAFTLGVASSVAGDRWNLGFLAETEKQVESHLAGHMASLPADDQRSRAIVDVMQKEEIEHAEMAQAMGARELPALFKWAMKLSSRVMTTLAYRI